MIEFLKNLFDSNFMPHGACMLWQPGVVGLHVASDALIGLAYYSIPLSLIVFVKKRRDLVYPWVFVMFGAFILACGTTHFMDIWTMWNATYRLEGLVKAGCAAISIATAVALWPLLPRVLSLPSPVQLRATNRELEKQIAEREKADAALRRARDELEMKVQERTAELQRSNDLLQQEVQERKQAEEKLGKSLKEKEVLLKEIHHRVKNNLQVVSSLINLQTKNINNPETIQLFEECQNRIQTMALIHEILYQSGNLAEIDFSKYLQSLTNHVLRSYRTGSSPVNVKIDVEKVFFDVNTAIPCGLIVNELVSNALKHGFPGERRGEIRVALQAQGDGDNKRFVLEVADNGIGMPEHVDFRTAQSTGLRLVKNLSNQLNGEVEITRNGGTAFKITFTVTEEQFQ